MLGGKEFFIRDTKREELARFCAMEEGDAQSFIIPYSLERHEAEFAMPRKIYAVTSCLRRFRPNLSRSQSIRPLHLRHVD
jgi:hypothetical protein